MDQHAESRNPMPGDIVLARYRWAHDDPDEPGKKVRPCLVIKAAPDSRAVILVPMSTSPDLNAHDSIEIRPSERRRAGVTPGMRSWIQLTQINRVDLPSNAIVPSTRPDGQFSWRRGTVSDDVLQQVQVEVGHRVTDKSLKGVHIKADDVPQMHLGGIRKVTPERETDDRTARVRAKAAERHARSMPEAAPARKDAALTR